MTLVMGCLGKRIRKVLVYLRLQRWHVLLLLCLGAVATVIIARNHSPKNNTRETIITKHIYSSVVTTETEMDYLQRSIAINEHRVTHKPRKTHRKARHRATLKPALGHASNQHNNNSQTRDQEHSNKLPLLKFATSKFPQPPASQLAHVSTSGYMMVILYSEQLESAVWDMYQLLNLAVSWNMKLVEPFLVGSYFGVPVLQSTDTLLRFSDLYNMTAVNDRLRECTHSRYPLIASHEEFATHTYTGVWLLDIVKLGVAECSIIFQGREDNTKVENRINTLSLNVSNGKIKQTIHISKRICIDARKTINFKELPYSLEIPIPKPKLPDSDASNSSLRNAFTEQQVSILFRHWSGIRNKPDKFYYHDPDFQTPSCPLVHTLEHSKMVKTAAQLLFAHLNLHRPLLGIHIRLEKLITHLDVEKPGAMKECVGKLMNTVKALKLKYNLKFGHVLALRDYDALGSQTCRQKRCYNIAIQLQLDAQLRALGVQLADYDPTVLRIPIQSGLASTVEKELISSSDYLLTVGWGSFQESVRDRILKHHPEDGIERLYTLCSRNHGDNLSNLAYMNYS